MATINQDPTQATLEAIDQMFNGLRLVSPFNDLGSIMGDEVPQEMDPGNGQVQPVGFIADGAIDDITLFADTIRPPVVVTSLPALPDTDYPVGSIVFLTTDAKLYRNTDGSTWSAVVAASDLTGTITSTQIADNAVTTPKVNAGAITTAKIAAGAITASEIAADAITAGQIAAGAIGTSELSASAVIANVANVGGTVLIDSSGIAISGGALSFLDSSGQTVLTGAGFGATWLDFINSMIYNNRFAAGTTNDITAVTEVSGGDSIADYAASLSADLPYWVVSAESGTGSFKRVASTSAPSGFVLEWLNNETAEIYQDVPISPGMQYGLFLLWRYTNSTSAFDGTVGLQFLDKDHAAITGVPNLEQALNYSTTVSSLTSQWMLTSNVSSSTARYLRIRIKMARTSGNPLVRIAAVNLVPTMQYGSTRIISGTLSFDGGYGIGWWDGATVDTVIDYVAGSNGQVKVRRPLGFGSGPNFWIENSNDATLSSTNHGLTIGASSAQQLIFDNNEIQSRNTSGANTAEEIWINKDGGTVSLANDLHHFSAAGNYTMDSGYILMNEITPPAGAANQVKIYVDDSAGTTRLRAVGPGSVRVTLASF